MGVIRLLLALSVVFAHSAPSPITGNSLVGGLVAVQTFFMISGFYIALVLNEKYTGSLRAFYFNRALRIYPTYFLVLLGVTALQISGGQPTWFSAIVTSEALSAGAKTLMLFAGLTLFGSDVMMFFYPAADGLTFTPNFYEEAVQLWKYHPIPQAWSLPVELMFYAMAPFIVRRPMVVLAVAAASIVARVWFYGSFWSSDPWSYRFLPFELFFFCLGSLAYFIYRKVDSHYLSSQIGFIGAIVIVAVMLCFNRIPGVVGNYWAFYGLVFVALPFIFTATRRNSIDGYFGELSYPVYVIHIAIIAAVGMVPLNTPTAGFNIALTTHLPPLRGFGVVLYSIIAAAIINLIFQRPIERWLKVSV